eukprot:3606670-Ditylum_brightwellii.AAC.1
MSAEQARNHARDHFYLSLASANPTKEPTCPPHPNGPIHSVCEVLRNVMSSTAEAEIGALYVNTRKGEELLLTLEEMGHPQPPTPVMTDISTACGIVNKTVKQRCTRAIGMQFYWVRDCCAQNHFIMCWAPGEKNLGEYHTKIHPTPHHKRMWKNFVHTQETVVNLSLLLGPTSLQGCIKNILDWSQVQSQVKNRPDGLKTKTDVRTKTDISEPKIWD